MTDRRERPAASGKEKPCAAPMENASGVAGSSASGSSAANRQESIYSDPAVRAAIHDHIAEQRLETRFAVCDGLHWLRSHESCRAAMVYFDPPYGHGTFGEGPGREWVEQVINEAWRVIADDGIVYLHGDPQLAWALEGANLPPLRGQIAWANGWVSGFKSRSTKFWPRQHQVILGFAKKDWRLRPVPRPAEEYRGVTRADSPDRKPNTTSFVYSDWWPDPNPVDQMSWSKEKVGYPTQKPLALMRRLIVGSTDPGDLVLDPSAGSGTTVVAALIEGRDGWGADISAEAAALATDRLAA